MGVYRLEVQEGQTNKGGEGETGEFGGGVREGVGGD